MKDFVPIQISHGFSLNFGAVRSSLGWPMLPSQKMQLEATGPPAEVCDFDTRWMRRPFKQTCFLLSGETGNERIGLTTTGALLWY